MPATKTSKEATSSVFESAEEVKRKLASIIKNFAPVQLPNYEVKVPFALDVLDIKLKKPVTIPFIIDYGFVKDDTLYARVGRRQVDRIRVYFGSNRVQGVVFNYAESDEEEEVRGIYGLAHLALPEVREALKEAEFKSDEGHGEKWIKEYLKYLDQASELDLKQLRLTDLSNKKVTGLYVEAENVTPEREKVLLQQVDYVLQYGVLADKPWYLSSRLNKLTMHLTERYMSITAETFIEGKEVNILYYFGEQVEKSISVSVDDIPRRPELAGTVLKNIAENERFFDTIKKSIMSFTNAYKTALVAYTLMNT